jgi:hypothetical protein
MPLNGKSLRNTKKEYPLSKEDSNILYENQEKNQQPDVADEYNMVLNSPRDRVVDYNSIQSRNRDKWVNDSDVLECDNCAIRFTLFTRRRHCRCCSSIFCHKCTENKSIIPVYLSIPKPPPNKEFVLGKDLVNVCNSCMNKLVQLRKLDILIKVFDNIYLTIEDYKNIGLVCKSWNQLSNFFLSKFREYQYRLSMHRFSQKEQSWLWINREFFIGHNLWMTQLIRSVYQNNYEFNFDEQCDKKNIELLHLLQKHENVFLNKIDKPKNCKYLMCANNCSTRFSSSDLISFLDKRVECIEVRKYSIEFMKRYPQDDITYYIPVLCNLIQHDYTYNIIAPYLLYLCQTDVDIAIDVYWKFTIMSETTNINVRKIYDNLIINWSDIISSNIQSKLLHILELENVFSEFYINSPRILSVHSMKTRLFAILSNLSKNTFTTIPTYLKLCDYILQIHKINIKSSITKPICLEYKSEENYEIHKVLYKNEDIRKDEIIMCVINLIKIILKREEDLDLNIITYKIIPTSSCSGFLEIVQNCDTLYNIKVHKKFTLLNYLIENNPRGDIAELRKRFLNSCAAYCVIEYLLGIGDRHLENIMMTEDGILFHIDYGFVLGKSSKPIVTPSMRITDDMIDILGGIHSRDFNTFKELCDRIYNRLRRHVKEFLPLLLLLAEYEPPILDNGQFTREYIVEEIINRFAPGESYHEAKLHLNNRIDNSTQTLSYTFIDFFHYHSTENTIGTIINNTVKSGKKWILG